MVSFLKISLKIIVCLIYHMALCQEVIMKMRYILVSRLRRMVSYSKNDSSEREN
jgi:hypothetical protein